MTDIDLSLYPETVEAFGGDEQRATVFLDRYAKKGSHGLPEESVPDVMFGRVALAMARETESGSPDATDYTDFMGILRDFKFVPGGRILAGAGVESEVTFYNCYVIPVETRQRRHNRSDGEVFKNRDDICLTPDPGCDSREAIIDTIGLMVDIMSRGGGVGVNWSTLRPSGAYLKRVNATSSGPIDWMHFASVAVGTVEQGGSRRGAAMFMLDDWHPDVLRFLDAKRDNTRITNANISVAVSDAFMEAVRNDDDWVLQFPDTSDPRYDEEWDGSLAAWDAKDYPVIEYQRIKARDLWRKLAEAAHASGEPGVVFLDRYNKQSTGQSVERLISVNPCGEQGLGAYSVCNLGAMNLDAYIVEKPPVKKVGKGKMALTVETVTGTTTGRTFDYEAFAKDVKVAVRFLDRVIDVNYYFIPENEQAQKNLRRIGLSVMGLADALVAVGLRYGSEGAAEFTEAVFRTMKHAAIEASIDLAVESGPAPAWSWPMAERPYFDDIPQELRSRLQEFGIRNLFLLTQAPTGTTSILAGVNSGIEPFFAFEYTRRDRTGEHRVLVPAMRKYRVEGTYPGGEWVTSGDVTVEEHIAMQAAVQKYVDSSVSKTINAPREQTVEETHRAYDLAYRSGLKGLAYYRDGSRDVQVLYKDQPAEKFQHIDWCQSTGAYGSEDCDCPETDREANLMRRIEELEERVAIQAADLEDQPQEFVRPDRLKGETVKVSTTAGTAYVTVNRDGDDVAREVFVNVGKAGSDITALAEALGRLASLSLRKGATLGGVANQLEGVGGSGNFRRPLASAIGQALTELNVRRNLTAAGNAPIGSKDLLATFSGLPVYKTPVVPAGAIYMGVDLAKGKDRTATLVSGANDLFDLPPQKFTGFPPVLEAEEDYTVEQQEERKSSADLCPDCGSISLIREEGCSKCHVCGFSAC